MDATDKTSSLSKHQSSMYQISKPQPTYSRGSLTSKKRRAMGVHLAARGRETRLGMMRHAWWINRMLTVAYPNAHCELDFRNPYELAVATILSVQCMDVRVNMTAPALFAKYSSPADLVIASQEEAEELARPTGFYRNEIVNIIGFTQGVMEQHGGEVPGTLDELVKLPGARRKIVNVVLGNAFGVSGLTVDTYFGRPVRRMGLTEQEDPVRVEYEMMEVLPHVEWTWFSHRLIFHGRKVCHSRRTVCGACLLAVDCLSYGVVGSAELETVEKLIKSDDREWSPYLAGLDDGYSEEEFSAFDDGDSARNTTATQDQSRSTSRE